MFRVNLLLRNYGKSSATKVDVICQAVRKGIEKIDGKKLVFVSNFNRYVEVPTSVFYY